MQVVPPYYGKLTTALSTMQVVPPALLTFSRAVLRERFSSFVSKPVYTFAFERALDVTDGLLLKLTTAVARRAVVCTTPAALKSFALKFLEVVHTLDYIARKEPDKKDSFIGALKLPWAKEKSTDHARLGVHHEQARRCCAVAAVMQRGVLMLDEVGLLLLSP